jgi:hypothetical protein
MARKKHTVICVNCEKSFHRFPYVAKLSKNQFCGRRCSDIYRTGKPRPTKIRMPLAERLWSKVDKSDINGCWPFKGSTGRNGVGQINKNGRPVGAHRVAYELTYGPIPDGLIVRHLVCDNSICCNPAHLALGTKADNSRDMVEHGRSTRGERNPMAILNPAQVLEIRQALSEGIKHRVIAARFNVCEGTISCIKRGKLWSHV